MANAGGAPSPASASAASCGVRGGRRSQCPPGCRGAPQPARRAQAAPGARSRGRTASAGARPTLRSPTRREASAVPPPRRRAHRLPRGGTGPPLALLHSAGPHPPRVRADRRRARAPLPASSCPTCRCTATPRTARAPVLAGVADRGAGRLPARHLRPAPAGRRPRRRRPARAARHRGAGDHARPKLVLLPNPMHTPAGAAGSSARGGPVRAAVVPGFDRVARPLGGARPAPEPRRRLTATALRARATWCATR